jgi:hypothetical protein
MAILFLAKSFVKINKLGGYSLKIQIFPKIQFFKIQIFHETRVGAFDSSSKITPGRLMKFI